MKRLIAIAIVLLSCTPARAECIGTLEELLTQIDVDDRALSESTENGYFIEELFLNSNGALVEKRKLDSIPDKYKYEGRIYPSKTQ